MSELGPTAELTAAQLKVAEAIGRRLSYKEIAEELNCSENTVKSHVRTMANKFDEPKELPPRSRILMWIKQEEWRALGSKVAPPGFVIREDCS